MNDELCFWIEQCDRLDDQQRRDELAEMIRIFLVSHLPVSKRVAILKEINEIRRTVGRTRKLETVL